MTPSAKRARFSQRRWILALLAAAGLNSYACGETLEPIDTLDPDGLGGEGGSNIVVPPDTAAGGTGGGMGGIGNDDLPPFEACELEGQGTLPSGAVFTLDDFEDGNASVTGSGLWGGWYDYDDDEEDEGEGRQTPSWDAAGGWLPSPGGLPDGEYGLHIIGSDYGDWGAGQGVSFVYDVTKSQECLFDASSFDGISFWIKGAIESSGAGAIEDQGAVKVGFLSSAVVPVALGGDCTGEAGSCYDWHKVRVTPSECWQRYSFTFDEFLQDGWGAVVGELSPEELTNLHFEVAQGNSYDYWVDSIEFFAGEPPEAEEVCDDLGAGGAGGAGGVGGT